MRKLLSFSLILACMFMLGTAVQAQVTPSDNLGIFPPGGPFNPNGKFTAIGESGGAPGPTVTGCALNP